MIIFGCFGGTTIWGNSHIYLDKYTFVGGSNQFETQCSSKCFFSATQLQHVQTKPLKPPNVLWICFARLFEKKFRVFFSELNLFHDRIEPNQHLPKTNECHPKKGSIFNRTYIPHFPTFDFQHSFVFGGWYSWPYIYTASGQFIINP